MQLIAWAFCYAQLKDGIQPLRFGFRRCNYCWVVLDLGCVGDAVAVSSLNFISLESLAKIAPAIELALTPFAEKVPFS